ncbi:bifunctional phosphoribosylaminoimidazolecarboxamide formyltransferase/IMP cyclohydrolase [candidate division KSB1 bacterium]|nr:bifunctional phosphoribosylaminoimidazolecarboxamide formyltransferase/IMP cyclohydrolase [candidate division KSB1 bacterium]MBL7092538.1 bifunctional phosphoribosylaminoimidazolecarboxamide formyltransferase/IMP cyclohydrolase [candidate division KSB1 bacterium]
MKKINRVLISVYDKQGIVDFARFLHEQGIEIISTGGTAKLLTENGIQCMPVSDVTNAPEMLDGRVKTLHPKIHGAILAKRDNPDHLAQLEQHGITPIDMVVINLYPFSDVISMPGTTLDIALENIDIGGPTMIRAAAKNFNDVAVVTSPLQYDFIIEEMEKTEGNLLPEIRKKLAADAFQLTNLYDGIISKYLSKTEEEQKYPDNISINFKKIQDLRYGENPHQGAAFYKEVGTLNEGITGIEQLHGKALSFNNIMDLDSVVKMVKSFEAPCSVIVKHSNPCGAAVGDNLFSAFEKAFATDSVSAFGGIFGFNRKLDLKTAEELRKIFIEVIVAPDFAEDAFQLLSKKKNLRLLKMKMNQEIKNELNYKRVAGGLLIQDEDVKSVDELDLKIVSKRQPSESELKAMKFAWRVVKWIKSNAVIFCSADRTIGIGAGQMSRVDSSMFAVEKAKRAGLPLAGTVVASDAFFPFRDGVDAAAEAGATAIIQPGGSVRDEEVIQAADEQNLAMVFTGVRHFRH